MRPLRYSINVTLDGCCDHRAVQADEELHWRTAALLAEADGLIFGRTTYEVMESAWRPAAAAGSTDPFVQMIENAKKYVVSSTLAGVDWNAELLGNDLESEIQRLKAQPGTGLYVGGVQLPRALATLGLIDEYVIMVHPRIVGHGPALFAGLPKPLDLELIEQERFDSGAAVLRYRPRP